ncbi:hypothetical protein L596_007806 [Steinernema carpocapsae]|uniref:Uncharacterized protein n=1 Tax=Steinernema carpocapsae TaxID=34508 RepID=A0A4U5PAK3_STECR|nr:hypothetical protein L596_007806 [Steinernema carpocapsae]
MPPQDSPPVLFSLFLLLLCSVASSQDVFCGHLSVFKQQWFSKTASTLSSQRTSDLKECLQQCCNVPNCKGVTFMGVIEESSDANCMLVNCLSTRCELSEKSVLTKGIISVLINRTKRTDEESASSAASAFTASPTSLKPDSTSSSSVERDTTPEPANLLDRFVRFEVAPIWVIGVAIVVVIVCIGLNIGLLTAYLCYRRRRNKRHTAQISGGAHKSTTLHAFNPTH